MTNEQSDEAIDKGANLFLDSNLKFLNAQVRGIYLSLSEGHRDDDTFFVDIVQPVLEFWKTNELTLCIREDAIKPPVDPIVAQLRIANLFLMHAHALRVDGEPEYGIAWALEAHYQFGVLEQVVDDRIAAIVKGRGGYKGKFESFGKLWARTLELARLGAWPTKAEAARQIALILARERAELGDQRLTTVDPEARIKKWLTDLLPPLEHDQIFPTAKAARRSRSMSTDTETCRVVEYLPRMFSRNGQEILAAPTMPRVRLDLQRAYAEWTPDSPASNELEQPGGASTT